MKDLISYQKKDSYRDLLVSQYLVRKEILRRKAKEGLLAFTLYTKPDYSAQWFHKKLCSKLDEFADGKIKRLMVFMPPRHGKSELVSRRLPAFLLGKNPDLQIIACSYADALASRMNRDVQRIIDHPDYIEIFPNTKLSGENVRTVAHGKWLRNSDLFEVVDHKGSYRSAGVGSGITGMGAHVAIIDDPIKDHKQADSETFRESVWEWYGSTLYSRLEKGGQILITLTRWHQDDLAGRLLNEMKNNPDADQWEIVSLPMQKEDFETPWDPRELGEVLWPQKYPKEIVSTMRSSMGPRFWNALYQQRPAASQGALVKRTDFKFWKELPARLDRIIQSWDMTFKETQDGSYVVGQVWGKFKADYFLIDQVRVRTEFIGAQNLVKTLASKHPKAIPILIEDKANGPAIISSLKREVSGIIPVDVKGSKYARFEAISPLFNAGNVYIPDPSIAPWVHDYIEELVSFPTGSHDDQVDATSQGLDYLRDKTTAFTENLIPRSIKVKDPMSRQRGSNAKW